MPNPTDPAILSGAQHVDQTEELAHGYTAPKDPSIDEVAEQNGFAGTPVKTHLAGLTLSMFPQGATVHVRVGSPNNSSELYEHAFATASEANSAMLDAGILTAGQVPDPSAPAGTHIPLGNITAEQLDAAGLKRHGDSNL